MRNTFRSSRILVGAVLAATFVTMPAGAGAQATRAPGGPSGPVKGPEVPLPGIELQVRGPGTRPIPPLRTNARGEFSVQLPEGEYRVTTSGRQIAGVVKSLACCPGDFDGDGTDDLNVGVALANRDYSADRGRFLGSAQFLKVTMQDLLITSIRIPKGGGTFAGRLWAVGGPRK